MYFYLKIVLYAYTNKGCCFDNYDPCMYEGILILGGDSSVYEYPKLQWLSKELEWIKKALY